MRSEQVASLAGTGSGIGRAESSAHHSVGAFVTLVGRTHWLRPRLSDSISTWFGRFSVRLSERP